MKNFLFAAIVGLLLLPTSAADAQSPGAPRQNAADAPSTEQISELLRRGVGAVRAVEVAEGVYMASGNSNAYRVVTPAGAVIIDTGLGIQAAAMKAALEAAAPAKNRVLILTHAHEDHIGGAPLWVQSGVEDVIVHRQFVERHRDYRDLQIMRNRRSALLWGLVMPEHLREQVPPEISPSRLVDSRYSFRLGGVRFEVLATPGAEGPDGLSVWLPERKILFSGDFYGPVLSSSPSGLPNFPNLFTLRGEQLRSAPRYLDSLEQLLALEPEMILPGHFDPVVGKEHIHSQLSRVRDAVAYVYKETVRGMNEGKDLFTLMQEIKLPASLQVSEQYGRVAWGVRAIWEHNMAWFRYESTTELYPVPVQQVYPDVVEMAGGAKTVVKQAQKRVDNGQLMEGLHLVEMALAANPNYRPALQLRRAVLSQLLSQSGGQNFQESGWLRARLRQAEEQLAR